MLALCGGSVVQIPRKDAASRREAPACEVMRAFHQYAIPALWLAWLIYWTIAAIGAKATLWEESFASRLSHVIPLALGAVLLATPHVPMAWLAARFLPRTAGWFWLGLVLVVLGIAFSVAARIWLGRNWSSMVTLKRDHELIRSGPYRWVRHPIYTGLLLAVLGTAITVAEWRGLIALALISAALLRKISIEERFLVTQFGAAYRQYRDEVPALLPLPWRSRRSR
jgi:protein-S-isoprenylcysteine O-methyltransferase Ste14